MTLELKNVLMALLVVVGLSAFVAVSVIVPVVIWAWHSAKKEVQRTHATKEPKFSCPRHGEYSIEDALFIDAPGEGKEKFEMCPFCVGERVTKKKVR